MNRKILSFTIEKKTFIKQYFLEQFQLFVCSFSLKFDLKQLFLNAFIFAFFWFFHFLSNPRFYFWIWNLPMVIELNVFWAYWNWINIVKIQLLSSLYHPPWTKQELVTTPSRSKSELIADESAAAGMSLSSSVAFFRCWDVIFSPQLSNDNLINDFFFNLIQHFILWKNVLLLESLVLIFHFLCVCLFYKCSFL